MELSTWMNLDVITHHPTRFHGELSDVRIKEQKLVWMILRYGSLFAPTLYFSPESILLADEKMICLEGYPSVQKEKRKVFETSHQDTLSFRQIKVEDCYGTVFGSVNDLWFDESFRITHYIISQSFFDDLDDGYLVLKADEFEEDPLRKTLIYKKSRNEIRPSPYQSGLIQKIFKEKEG